MDDRVAFGHAWSKETVIHPVVLAIVIAMGLAMLLCPRRYATWPVIVVACFVVHSQRLVVGGLDFSMLRIMTVIGFVRIFFRGEMHMKWRGLDTAVVVFVFARTIVPLLTNDKTFLTRLGGAMDTVGIYLMFRYLVRNRSDVFDAVRGFAWIGIVVAGFFIVEFITHKNVFAAFGYVSEDVIQRGNRFRCQGAFAHPILAGCFWATVMPLMAAMWFRGGKASYEAFIGLTVSSIIIITCASSTPIAAVIFALVGLAMFPLRYSMGWVRWAVVLALVIVQITWTKPVYALMARADLVGGSTGYYRYQLIDAAVKHLSEWATLGMSAGSSTADWIPGLKDVTNQYLLVGLEGGLALLGLFLLMIVVAFSTTGRTWRRAAREHDTLTVYLGWALGVSLFLTCMNFLSVSYFGQILMVWALLLAMIAAMAPSKKRRRVPQQYQAAVEQEPPVRTRAATSPAFRQSFDL